MTWYNTIVEPCRDARLFVLHRSKEALNIDWKAEAKRLYFDEHQTWGNIIAKLQSCFTDRNADQIRDAIRGAVRNDPRYKAQQGQHNQPVNAQEALMKALTKGATAAEVADALGVSERIATAMIDEKIQAGYNIRETNGIWKISNDIIPSENHYKNKWDGDRIIRFGLMGDTQINSKYTQITHLHRLYEIYAEQGIKQVYHTGDIDEGEQMRKGHQYELYNQGVDDHKDEIARVYPKHKGITTSFITGNHDASMIRLAGIDIGRQIAAERSDMAYLGQDSAVIQLTDNCTLELRHPGDGTAYALSYKTQKIIEAMSGGEKPNILAVGHYHKVEYLFYRNVHLFQTGCMQAQTPWMRGKGIAAAMGGWIVEVHLNVDGGVERIMQELVPFYTAIKDDWKQWR